MYGDITAKKPNDVMSHWGCFKTCYMLEENVS
jgi:hypothetical protein